MGDEKPPLHLPDIVAVDAPVHVATIVLMNVVAIHLDKAEVCFVRDDPFQVYPLLS